MSKVEKTSTTHHMGGIVQHNQYILIMIEHFLKWLNLVPLLYCNSEGTTYAFWTRCLVGLFCTIWLKNQN
jgi:hypothetical protein